MFDKNKESKTTCPHCHKNLPNGVLAYYLINKMTDVTQCPHCKTDIKLQKNITKFSYWQSIIVAIIMIYGSFICNKYFELNWLLSLLLPLLAVIVVAAIMYSVLFKKMKFVEA